MGNLTIRIDSELKRDADRAAALLDVSVSQVIRKALRALVQQAKNHGSWEQENNPLPVGVTVPTSVAAQHVKLKGRDHLRMSRLRRIADLEVLEKANNLNKVTRQELKELRMQEMCQ